MKGYPLHTGRACACARVSTNHCSYHFSKRQVRSPKRCPPWAKSYICLWKSPIGDKSQRVMLSLPRSWESCSQERCIMLILSCPVGLPTQPMFAMPPALFSAYLTTLFTPHSLKSFRLAHSCVWWYVWKRSVELWRINDSLTQFNQSNVLFLKEVLALSRQ